MCPLDVIVSLKEGFDLLGEFGFFLAGDSAKMDFKGFEFFTAGAPATVGATSAEASHAAHFSNPLHPELAKVFIANPGLGALAGCEDFEIDGSLVGDGGASVASGVARVAVDVFDK